MACRRSACFPELSTPTKSRTVSVSPVLVVAGRVIGVGRCRRCSRDEASCKRVLTRMRRLLSPPRQSLCRLSTCSSSASVVPLAQAQCDVKNASDAWQHRLCKVPVQLGLLAKNRESLLQRDSCGGFSRRSASVQWAPCPQARAQQHATNSAVISSSVMMVVGPARMGCRSSDVRWMRWRRNKQVGITCWHYPPAMVESIDGIQQVVFQLFQPPSYSHYVVSQAQVCGRQVPHRGIAGLLQQVGKQANRRFQPCRDRWYASLSPCVLSHTVLSIATISWTCSRRRNRDRPLLERRPHPAPL